MNCKEWVECMTPEQWTLLIGSLIALVMAILGAIVVLVQWLPKYISRLADENFKAREHKRNIEDKLTETELQNKRTEAEVDAQQALALPEAFEKTITMFGQSLERHAKTDERNAENAEKWLEVSNKLVLSLEALNTSTRVSQNFQERRTDDLIDTANLINERVGGLERVGKSVIDSMTKIEVDLSEVRNKLNRIIEAHPTFAQQNTLLAIESGLASVKLMLESLVPKEPIVPVVLVEREKEPSLDDTIPLSTEDMLAATKKLPEIDLTEIPEHIATPKTTTNEDLPKAS